jgi:hypothetical protein
MPRELTKPTGNFSEATKVFDTDTKEVDDECQAFRR